MHAHRAGADLEAAEKELTMAMELAQEANLGVFQLLAAAELSAVLQRSGHRGGEGQSLVKRAAATLDATPAQIEAVLREPRCWAMR